MIDEFQDHVIKVSDVVDVHSLLTVPRKARPAPLSCMACNTFVGIVKSLWIPIDFMANLMIKICSSKYNTVVCNGIINLIKEPIDEIRHKSRVSPKEICAIVLGDQCLGGELSDNVYWKLNVTEKRKKLKITDNRSKKKTLYRILHITDIHLDTYYVPLTPDCGTPYCCRKYNISNRVGNESVDLKEIAGHWGSYYCDPPLNLMDNLFKSIDWQSFDWIYWTGDVTPHDIWADNKNETIGNSRIITDYLKKFTNKTVIGAFGNHISLPVGTFSPQDITGKLSTRYLYEETAKEWSQWLPTKALPTFLNGGYYSLTIRPGFKIIVVNTNYCSRFNLWTYYEPIDLGNQLKWLMNELELAENAGEKVHIVGHIPPDNEECTQGWLYNYMAIVERFSDTIVGQFYGHTHVDEFRTYYSNNDSKKVIGFAVISPSVAPYDQKMKLNPAYRIIKCNQNGVIQDMETYSTDLGRANSEPKRTPDWPFEYSMAKDYSMGFTNNDFDRLVYKIKRNDKYLQLYYARYTRFPVNANQFCNNDCKNKLIGNIIATNAFESDPKPLSFG